MRSLLLDLQHSLAQAPEHQHVHLSCEMVYVRRGRARFTIAGADYTAGPGCLVFISSLDAEEVDAVAHLVAGLHHHHRAAEDAGCAVYLWRIRIHHLDAA